MSVRFQKAPLARLVTPAPGAICVCCPKPALIAYQQPDGQVFPLCDAHRVMPPKAPKAQEDAP